MSRIPSVLILLAVLVSARGSFARRAEVVSPSDAKQPSAATSASSPAAVSPATIGVLQLWTFDNGGNPDAQGWTSVDLTAQPAYFHVDPNNPISGTKSLWCGLSSCPTSPCTYATLPGYGNNWDQTWMSIPFTPLAGQLDVSFQIRYDTEPSYDLIYLEYSNDGSTWNEVASWNGIGSGTLSYPIATASPTRVRFRVHTDNGFSDEDGSYPSNGAVYIDNLAVTNATVTDNHPFNSEADGATVTADGHWAAYGSAFGNFAGLFDGDNVAQDDPGTFNATNMWGFFQGSTSFYACGNPSHPLQASVPLATNIEDIPLYIRNRIESPAVSLTGVAASEPVLLSFDGYPDLPMNYAVLYRYHVQSRVAGVWQPWKQNNFVYDDETKAWKTFTYNIRPLILANATDIRVAISVVDMCAYWCPVYSDGTCHSHGPLVDNVRVTLTNTATGNSVLISPTDETTGTNPVSLLFAQITQPGLTSLVTAPTGPAMPGSFQIGDGTYYNVSTTASYSGNIQICITYNEAALTVPEGSLRMLHWDTTLDPDAWVDVTMTLNTTTNVICGNTTTLSPFVIGSGSLTGVGDSTPGFALHQNVPNPFNPTTSITYEVPAGGAVVALRIYDAAGRLVRTLVDEQRPGGTHSVAWDGRNGLGETVASGVYFYRMTAGSFTESRRMVLLK